MTPWPIFIISLPDAVERQRSIRKALQEIGLDFEFIEAIDGRHGLPYSYETQIDRIGTKKRLGRDMSDGEYACALSHQKAYSTILDRGLPGGIVLEDDAVILPGFREFCAREAYNSANLIALDHINAHVWRFWRKRPYIGVELRRVSIKAGLNTGYSISREGAQFMNLNSFPISSVADWPCDVRKIGMCATAPRLIGHPEGDEAQSYLRHSRDVEKKKQRRKSKSETSRPRIKRLLAPRRLLDQQRWQNRIVSALSFRLD